MQSRHDTVKPNTGPAIPRDSRSVTDYRAVSRFLSLIVLRGRSRPDRIDGLFVQALCDQKTVNKSTFHKVRGPLLPPVN